MTAFCPFRLNIIETTNRHNPCDSLVLFRRVAFLITNISEFDAIRTKLDFFLVFFTAMSVSFQ